MTLHHAVAAVALLCCIITEPVQHVTFTTLDRGDHSGIEEPRTVMARTVAEWSALWKAHAGTRKAPDVDLGRSMVVGVFAGSRPTAGHAVEITRIERQDATLVVTYREQRPGPGDMVAQMLTSPFHLVQTPAHAGPVKFQQRP